MHPTLTRRASEERPGGSPALAFRVRVGRLVRELLWPNRGSWAKPAEPAGHAVDPGPAQDLIRLTCRDEQHQVDLLSRFYGEDRDGRALLD
jgi:hypothetical protein